MLEANTPFSSGQDWSAAPLRFVLLQDGSVFLGGSKDLLAGHLEKAEIKALEAQIEAVRKLPGLASVTAFGGDEPAFRLRVSKGKPLDLRITGDPAECRPAPCVPWPSLLEQLLRFDHSSLRPYAEASPRPPGPRGHAARRVSPVDAHRHPRGGGVRHDRPGGQRVLLAARGRPHVRVRGRQALRAAAAAARARGTTLTRSPEEWALTSDAPTHAIVPSPEETMTAIAEGGPPMRHGPRHPRRHRHPHRQNGPTGPHPQQRGREGRGTPPSPDSDHRADHAGGGRSRAIGGRRRVRKAGRSELPSRSAKTWSSRT